MPVTTAWGESLTVTMTLGAPQDVFTLDSATDGVLDTDYLDGNIVPVDVSQYVQDVRITRGRQDQLGQFSAGSCGITLLNNDRRFDPSNEGSPYWDSGLGRSGVSPRRKVVVTMDGEPLFAGRITDIDLSYATGKTTDLSTVDVLCADDFVLLANVATSQNRTPTEELSGARLDYLLQLGEINYTGTTDIDTGTAVLGAYQLSANTNALQYAQAIAEAEQGYFFVARDGTLTFTDRVSSAFSNPVAAFSDDDGTDIKYQTLSIQYGQEFLYNKVVATRQTGTPQIANDVASQDEYGITTLTLDGLLLSSDAAAQTLANDLLNLYAEPAFRFDGMGILVSAQSPADRQVLNRLELGEMVTVERNYVTGSPAQVTKNQTVERLIRVITPNAHRLEVAMADAFVVYPFVLDTSTLDTEFALT